MDQAVLLAFEESLQRCSADARFLDLFYEQFLASTKVKEKFRNTDFTRQKKALRDSFDLLLLAARDSEGGPQTHLAALTARHGAGQLAIGAEYYDYWLDSLLTTVRTCDPAYSHKVEKAWEAVMGVGIQYLCSHYHDGAKP